LFKDIFDDDVDLSDLVKQCNHNLNDDNILLSNKNYRRKWIVELPYKIILKYMKEQANSICKIINEINSKEEIKTIIFVGGYCYNEIIIQLIKNGLNKITTHLKPSNPSLAIMEGAVLFGIKPSIINIRKAKFTIGKKMNMKWNDEKHSEKGKKYYDEDDKNWRCRDCFEKFIEINQNLKYGEEISHLSFISSRNKKNDTTMEFYKTKTKNPTFVFEEGIIKIGECRLEIDKEYENFEERKLKTIMKFGGTYIDITAIHLKSGKTVKTTLTFD
jgi:hypothetical protein